MDALSGSDDVCISFTVLLNEAQERLALPGLEQVSFFYDVPDEGLGAAQVSGYVHFNKNIRSVREAALRTWLNDDRISGEIEWQAVLPGKNRDWRQHRLIQSLFAACEGGSLRREDWVGESSGAMRRGGRPSKASTQTARRPEQSVECCALIIPRPPSLSFPPAETASPLYPPQCQHPEPLAIQAVPYLLAVGPVPR